MSRAQSIVCRDDRILMVKHRADGAEWWCLPGGGILEGESPRDAAVRELQEECRVTGVIVRETSVLIYGPDDKHFTFLVDIGTQEPELGCDPEFGQDDQILAEVRWMSLDEVPERDRAFLWAAGLLSVGRFFKIVESWGASTSYPQRIESV